MEEKIRFQTKAGISLMGKWHTGAEKEKCCCILCHGFFSDKDNILFQNLQKRLEVEKIDSFAFDFRSYGESEGKKIKLGISDEVEDLEAAFQWIEDKKYKKIILFGEGMGASIVSLFLKEKSKKVKKVVLWNPLLDFSEAFIRPILKANKEQHIIQTVKEKGFIKITENKQEITISKKFFEEVGKLIPWKELIDAKCQVVFIQPKENACNSQEQIRKCYQMCKKASFITLDKENPEKVIEEVMKK